MSGDPRQVATPHTTITDESGLRDPLRLCVLTTTALLGWLLGPLAVLVFAVLGVVGYVSARRAGLLRSRCKLGDTRLVIAYLAVVAVAAAAGIGLWIGGWSVGLR